jgi:hypothetical protein
MTSSLSPAIGDPRPETFQSFWHGPTLSLNERLSMSSFVNAGHSYDLYSFNRELAVPAGVNLRDARELANEDEFFVYADGPGKGSPAAFSNLFRYRLLAERGGWWVDTDVIHLGKPLTCADLFFAREDDTFVATGVLRFPRQHPVVLRCLDEAEKAGKLMSWGVTGPRLMTRIIAENGLFDRAAAAETAYPIHWSRWHHVLKPSARAAVEQRLGPALFLHLWNELFRRAGVDKNIAPPRGSYLRWEMERHGVAGWTREHEPAPFEEMADLPL